jgi:hypothetical protein
VAIYLGNSHQPYDWKVCAYCGLEDYILRSGKFCSQECMGLSRTGTDNPSWRPKRFSGTLREYKRFHKRVYSKYGKASKCIHCEGSGLIYEWANVTGNFSNPDDYIELCTMCHNRFDRRTDR